MKGVIRLDDNELHYLSYDPDEIMTDMIAAYIEDEIGGFAIHLSLKR